jgi:sugar/nucleoside kinase (ribokinase family)/ribosomal protein S18 acetylase RimI-like enzyme
MIVGPLFDVVGAGTMAVDDLLYVEQYPPSDHKVRIHGTARHLGGQIATALAAASSLGAHCACAGVLGQDEFSCAMRQGLAAAGVDLRFMREGDASPIHSVVIAESISKSRTIFYDPHRAVAFPAVEAADLVQAARVLLIDQLGPETGLEIVRLAKEFGIRVVLDLEWPDDDSLYPLLAGATDVLVSRSFGSALTGSDDPERILKLLDGGTRNCTAVTCGAQGCYAMIGNDPVAIHIPSFSVEVVETTGCGDVFHGAYAACLAQGFDVAAALEFAAAAAAVYASRPTGWNHLPLRTDVAGLLERMTGAPRDQINLRKIGVDDWSSWRTLRLEALAEAPYAFGSKLADWQGPGDTEARWRARLSDVPLNIIAEWRDQPAGMISATAADADGSIELISTWVAPFARGHGVGDALVSQVIVWAREQQASKVALAVFETNERAHALYRRHGFVDVGAASAERKMVRLL